MTDVAYEERFVSAQDGLLLYFRDYGRNLADHALPVLCLGGLTRNSADFHHVATRLCRKRRILSFDYRGRGRSARDPNWRNYDPMVYLNDIGQLLTAVGVGRCIVIGTSMGGMLAMALAIVRPSAVAGVVVNDIGPDVDPGGLSRIIDFIGTDRPQPDWSSAVAMLRAAMPPLSLRTEQAWLDFAKATFRMEDDGLLHFDWDVAIARPLRRPDHPVRDLWPVFRGIADLPALVIRGGVSDVLTADGLARMIAVKPDLGSVTVPDVGHCPALDEPEVESALDEFLARF